MKFAKIYEFPNEFRGEQITYSDVMDMVTSIFKARFGENATAEFKATKILSGWTVLVEWRED
jgi:hypothetical protein